MKKIMKYGLCAFSVMFVENSNFGMKRTRNFGDLSSGEEATLPIASPTLPDNPNATKNQNKKSSRLKKFGSFSETEWKDILNSEADLPTRNGPNDNCSQNQSDESSEISEEIILPKNPVDELVKPDISKKTIHIAASSNDRYSMFYPMFERASFLGFTLTKNEISKDLSKSRYKHNWIESVEAGWHIQTRDNLNIEVISTEEFVQCGRDAQVDAQKKMYNLIKSAKKTKNTTETQALTPEPQTTQQTETQALTPEPQTTQQPATLNLKKVPKTKKAGGNTFDYAKLEYSPTDNLFVKYNLENKVILIENLPICNRVNPSKEEIKALDLYGLIRFGVTHNFEITMADLKNFSLPIMLLYVVGIKVGWHICFNGVDVIEIVNNYNYRKFKYTSTESPFVKYNLKNKVILIEDLPDNPDEDVIASSLRDLIEFGVANNFEIPIRELLKYPLPDSIDVREGWIICFNGVDIIKVIKNPARRRISLPFHGL